MNQYIQYWHHIFATRKVWFFLRQIPVKITIVFLFLQAGMAAKATMFETHPRLPSRYNKHISFANIFSFPLMQYIFCNIINTNYRLFFLQMLFLLLGDKHVLETIANVLTSLPFIVLGIHAPRWESIVICLMYLNLILSF